MSDNLKRTFERCFGILKSGGSLSRKEGSGRPRKLFDSDSQRLPGISLKNTNFSSYQIAHPNSPDLNQVENVWQIFQHYVEKKNPRNVEELRAYIQESQVAITQKIQVRLMESISRRLE